MNNDTFTCSFEDLGIISSDLIYREIKGTTRLLGIIVRPYSQISEEILSRPRRPRRARPACVSPAAPGASALAAGEHSWEHCNKTMLHALYLAGTC